MHALVHMVSRPEINVDCEPAAIAAEDMSFITCVPDAYDMHMVAEIFRKSHGKPQ